ncbi:MAG: hypothetical protein R2854_06470 [Caldilineaceae bacterium]
MRLIEKISKRKGGEPVNVLTHCNGLAGLCGHGLATAPVCACARPGHSRARVGGRDTAAQQGARLTAWELGEHGVPHTIIPDNVGGHLVQHGLVDLVITGTDRTTYTGDVAKIGTYLKALAARQRCPLLRGAALFYLRLADARRRGRDPHRTAGRHRGALHGGWRGQRRRQHRHRAHHA